MIRRWVKDPEALVCAWSGHVAPAASVARLRPQDAALGVDVGPAQRLVRCLRCDAWLQVVPPTGAEVSGDELPPLGDLDLPERGRALEDRLVLRLIAVERALHVVLFGVLAIAASLVELRIDWLRSWAEQLLSTVRDDTARGVSHGDLARWLEDVVELRRATLGAVALASGLYAAVEVVEAVGLWRGRRWAEYLTFTMTAVFLPFEIRELAEGVSPLKVVALAVNVAVVVYLVWHKRLFGLRGGASAVGDDVDWDEIVAEPRPPFLARTPAGPTTRRRRGPNAR